MAHGYAAGLNIIGPAISAGASSASSGTVIFSNSNGVTFGLSTAGGGVHTMTASAAAGGADGGVFASAAGNSITAGTLVLSNSNNVSFGMAGSTITATATVATSLTAVRVSAGTTSNLLSAMTFADGGNVSFGINASTVTASVASSLTAVRVSAGTTSNLLSAVTLADSNGISFGLNASTLTASYTRNVASNAIQSVGTATGSGTNTSRFAADDHVHAGVPVAGISGGNTLGETGSRYGSVLFAGGANITLSGATAAGGQTITISGGAGGAGDGFNILSAGTQLAATNTTVLFADSNGISFGMSGSSRITASYTRNVASNAIQSVGSATGSGTNTSRFAPDDHVHAGVFSMGVSTGGNTLGDTRVDVGRFVLVGGANITLSQGTAVGALNTITISAPAPGGVIATSVQSVHSASSVGTVTRFAPEDHRHRGVGALGISTQGVGDTGTTFGVFVLSAGVGGLGMSQQTGAGGTHTIILEAPFAGTIAEGVASANASGGPVTNEYAIYNHSHAGVFSVGVSTGGNTAGNTRVSVGQFVFVGGANITLSQGTAAGALNTITISGAAGGGGLTNIRVSAGTTSNLLSAITFSDSNGVSFGINASTLTASVATSLTNFRVSAGTTSNLLSAITFSDSNGISFGLNASTVTASYTRNVASNAIQSVGSATGSGTNTTRFAADDHVHAGVFSVGVSTGGNTLGDTRVDVGRFVFAGGANITLSQATAAGGLNTITISGGAGGAAFSGGISNLGNTAGSTGVVSQRLVLVASNALSASGSTDGGSATVSLFGPHSATTISRVESANVIGTRGSRFALEDHQHEGLYQLSVAGNTSGTTSAGAGSFVLAGGPNITLSGSTAAGGITLSVSANAPGAAAENNWHHLTGNTAGNTTASGSTIMLSGGNNITLSGTNGSQIRIDGAGPATLVHWEPIIGMGAIRTYQILTNGSLWMVPFPLPGYMEADRINQFVKWSNATNSTGTASFSWWYGAFTRSLSTLSLATSSSYSLAITYNGTAESSLNFGHRYLSLPIAMTMTPAHYWIGLAVSSATGGANGSMSSVMWSSENSLWSGSFGVASNNTDLMFLGFGKYSTTTSAIPASIAFSQLQLSTLRTLNPHFVVQAGTV